MKQSSIIKVVAMAIVIGLAACKSKQKVEETVQLPPTQEQLEKDSLIKKVYRTAINTQYVSSKLKFTVEMGPQKLRLTGNLRMKRDDVIRLQLMAFGFVEAGRLEFTRDYVLMLDRINKQYLQVPYKYIDFLRNSNIDFFTLQALFWNELFIPGTMKVDQHDPDKFSVMPGGDEAVISLQEGRMNYSWLANQQTGRIKMANIIYEDPTSGNSQLNWDYDSYGQLNGKLFPDDMIITLTLPGKEVKMEVKLTYLGNDQNWEPRTTVSDKYRKVDVEDMMRRFMTLG